MKLSAAQIDLTGPQLAALVWHAAGSEYRRTHPAPRLDVSRRLAGSARGLLKRDNPGQWHAFPTYTLTEAGRARLQLLYAEREDQALEQLAEARQEDVLQLMQVIRQDPLQA